ncbi:MAG: hypothetical protein V4812_12955 [Pseudomonadota bacterium]
MALLAEVSDSRHRILKNYGLEIIRQTRLHSSRDLPVLPGFHGHQDSEIRHWERAWNALISTGANGSRFGYRYINPQGTWVVAHKEKLARKSWRYPERADLGERLAVLAK